MDNLSSADRRKNMQRIRSKKTVPEQKIAKELRRLKIYCTRNDSRILGKPDFVFRRRKVVVFVDSDFWHGHPERFIMPKTNVEYWQSKIEKNKVRDLKVTIELEKLGWKVIRIWEHEVMRETESVMERIVKTLR
jgi:DNA mismatch endonuclease (patch repair protein)